MRVFLTILICKIVRFLAKLFGRGSALPGKIALKLDKDILGKIQMPKYVIAVSGSNGKTSTVEMIRQVIDNANLSYAYNYEGSNQIDGVATLVLCNCSLSGKYQKDVLLLESDERYAKYTFSYFKPTHFVITNLYRDQMTRNGHPEYVLSCIEEAIKEGTILILNGDDPLISSISKKYDNEVYFFGMEKNKYSTLENNGLYNDGYYCPICKEKMNYDYYHFNHVGSYSCSCGFKRKADYKITDIDLSLNYMVINDKVKINLAFSSIYNAYNILATYALANLLGINDEIISKSLNNYLIKNGRLKKYKLGDKEGILLISKHENSISYNQNIRYITSLNKEVSVFILIDAISRKYFTSETSWLWDIDFELLANTNVKKIYLAGTYAYDLATRFEYSGIDFNKIIIEEDYVKGIEKFKKDAIGDLYTITCFSDEAKFMKEVDHD